MYIFPQRCLCYDFSFSLFIDYILDKWKAILLALLNSSYTVSACNEVVKILLLLILLIASFPFLSSYPVFSHHPNRSVFYQCTYMFQFKYYMVHALGQNPVTCLLKTSLLVARSSVFERGHSVRCEPSSWCYLLAYSALFCHIPGDHDQTIFGYEECFMSSVERISVPCSHTGAHTCPSPVFTWQPLFHSVFG